MNAMKRTLAALVLSGGAAIALTPGLAQAADQTPSGPPITARLGDIVDHPSGAVKDAKTAVGVAAGAANTSAHATDSSLVGTGTALETGLPKAPKVGTKG
ncbi:hypothetical protein [Streptomyces sp. G-G2]|uniref:hypothetical protein n=1 Tax=Streptomyces sp. G-G2 TaxID=3046201 RepID=UPI0024B8A49C|nr:hypothetical protein [Streptomyces sp. G-G2]MDJ0381446.1 hypothetical protein [Streptomyces sp. G-G2]